MIMKTAASVLRVLLLLLPVAGFTEDWTRFRGPNGSGVSTDTGFPTEFGRDKNVIWRTPVRPGKSSPVLTSSRIFLTAFENRKLVTQCFDRKTGKMLWERALERPRAEDVNPLNHPAAITPVTDGENVYVLFKDFGLISYDPDGNVRWKVALGPFTNLMGLGASPIVAADSIVLLADQSENSYIAAFDRRNGEIRWKIAREESESWGTPLFYEPPGAAPLILTASRGQFGAHLLANGSRALTQHGLSPTIVASPVLGKDKLGRETLFVFGYGSDSATPFSSVLERYDKNHDGKLSPDEYVGSAFILGIGTYGGKRDLIVTKEMWDAKQREVIGPSRLVAIRLEPDSSGPEGQTIRARELWRYDKSFTGVVPSPILYEGILYVVKNGGILTSFDAETGEVTKTGRLRGALGGYSASPIAADGKLFLLNEDGKATVLRAGRDWDVIRVNDLGESCHATPALSGGQVYLRTSEALYCFGAHQR
jgi:outer membrane protein assembly factor BamB